MQNFTFTGNRDRRCGPRCAASGVGVVVGGMQGQVRPWRGERGDQEASRRCSGIVPPSRGGLRRRL